ncbi:unnamed protein product [Phaeothamnion confervicola]
MIREHLRPGGEALVAAKRYYFGAGGSTADFRALVNSDDVGSGGGSGAPPLRCDVIETFNTGAANIRELLRVTHVGPGAPVEAVAKGGAARAAADGAATAGDGAADAAASAEAELDRPVT